MSCLSGQQVLRGIVHFHEIKNGPGATETSNLLLFKSVRTGCTRGIPSSAQAPKGECEWHKNVT